MSDIPKRYTPTDLETYQEQYNVRIAAVLNSQIVDAVDLVVQEWSKNHRKSLQEYSEQEIYDSVRTFVVRLVFMIFAEERQLLPVDKEAYALSLLELEKELRDKPPLLLKTSCMGFSKTLSRFHAIHADFEGDIRLEQYGRALFHPEQAPLFYEDTPFALVDEVLHELLLKLIFIENEKNQ